MCEVHAGGVIRHPLATKHTLRPACLWLAAFLTIAAVAPTSPGLHADQWARAHAATLPHGVHTALLAVWPLGQPPFAITLAVLLTLDRRIDWPTRLRAWAGLISVEVVEAIFKHYGVGSTVPLAPAPLPHSLQAVTRHLAMVLPSALAASLDRLRVGSSFPSGHVLRLTIAANYLVPWPNAVLPTLAAAVVGFGVVASGGHSLTDALGGATLAMAALAAIGRLPVLPRHPVLRRRSHRRAGAESPAGTVVQMP